MRAIQNCILHVEGGERGQGPADHDEADQENSDVQISAYVMGHLGGAKESGDTGREVLPDLFEGRLNLDRTVRMASMKDAPSAANWRKTGALPRDVTVRIDRSYPTLHPVASANG